MKRGCFGILDEPISSFEKDKWLERSTDRRSQQNLYKYHFAFSITVT
jgi:hypothetical protein